MNEVTYLHLVNPKKHSCFNCRRPAPYVLGDFRLWRERIVGSAHSYCSGCLPVDSSNAVPAPKAGAEYHAWMLSVAKQLRSKV